MQESVSNITITEKKEKHCQKSHSCIRAPRAFPEELPLTTNEPVVAQYDVPAVKNTFADNCK